MVTAEPHDDNLESMLEFYLSKTGIQVPQTALDYYLSTPKRRAFFEKDFRAHVEFIKSKERYDDLLSIFLSEALVAETLRMVDDAITAQKTPALMREIKAWKFGNDIQPGIASITTAYFENGDPDIEEFTFSLEHSEQKFTANIYKFICETVLRTADGYDVRQNRFRFSMLDDAFERLGREHDLFDGLLIFHADCGGFGGLVMLGKHRGDEALFEHGDTFKRTTARGHEIAYEGFAGSECYRTLTC